MNTYTTTINSMYTLNTPEQGFVVNVLFKVIGTDGTTSYTQEQGGVNLFC